MIAAGRKPSRQGEAAHLDGIGADLAAAVLGNPEADFFLSPNGQEVASQLADVLPKAQHPPCQLPVLRRQPLPLQAQIACLLVNHNDFSYDLLQTTPSCPRARSCGPITSTSEKRLTTFWPALSHFISPSAYA